MILWTLVAALVLVAAHLFGARLGFRSPVPRSRWLSLAGGVSVAYVFVHLMPELHGRQQILDEWEALSFLDHHVNVAALAGLSAFYGLERLVRVEDSRRGEGAGHRPHVYRLHIAAFGLYNVLIGYLLVDRDAAGGFELLVFAVALALHFVVNDHGLRQIHQDAYRSNGRWILAAAVLAGWAAGTFTTVPERVFAVLFAFLAGAIILNVLKEELPEERQSRFWAFAAGAAGYTVLLFLAG